MGQLTPQFLFDLESRMRIITAGEYQRLTSELKWRILASQITMTGAKERLIWLLDTAKIEYVNALGSEVEFDQVLSRTTEFEAKAATGGLEMDRFKLDDIDGGGVQLATQWSRAIGQYAAYWPQKQVLRAVRDGGLATSVTYDGKPFFATDHPLNPFDSSLGNFANDLTGAASGVYPGAVPISGVSLDVAFENLQKVFTYIRSIKMVSGEDPRMLRPGALIVPPALSMRAQQLTNAKYIAQAASSGGGSADVEAVINNWGIGQPVEFDELSSAFPNGSDTDYYVVAKQVGEDELGPLTYLNREPFTVLYNDGMTDAQLARANKLQWITRGRNVVGYGHPYLLFRCRAS